MSDNNNNNIPENEIIPENKIANVGFPSEKCEESTDTPEPVKESTDSKSSVWKLPGYAVPESGYRAQANDLIDNVTNVLNKNREAKDTNTVEVSFSMPYLRLNTPLYWVADSVTDRGMLDMLVPGTHAPDFDDMGIVQLTYRGVYVSTSGRAGFTFKETDILFGIALDEYYASLFPTQDDAILCYISRLTQHPESDSVVKGAINHFFKDSVKNNSALTGDTDNTDVSVSKESTYVRVPDSESEHTCYNCRWCRPTDRPRNQQDPCGGCVGYNGCTFNWKPRTLWQRIRDWFNSRFRSR